MKNNRVKFIHIPSDGFYTTRLRHVTFLAERNIYPFKVDRDENDYHRYWFQRTEELMNCLNEYNAINGHADIMYVYLDD